jgi:translation elongation factor EF-G
VAACVLQRRGRILTQDDMIEGTSIFILRALLPVANSFGFAVPALYF